MKNEVIALGTLASLVAPSVEYANTIVEKQRAEFKYQARVNGFNEIKEQMLDIKDILQKANISFRDFPFKPERNSEGEVVGFIPKGKNVAAIKNDIKEYQLKIEDAFQSGKISDEEYALLNSNLETIMEKRGIELDKEVEIGVTYDKVEGNVRGFIAHNFGSEENFERLCSSYDDFEFEKRKECLQKFNSSINVQLGIAGDVKFSSNSNMNFGNSFYDKGYYITEKQIETQSLEAMLRSMMEKSMVREAEIKRGEKIVAWQKQQLHMKIERERQQRNEKYEKERNRKNANNIKRRVYGTYGNN